MFVPFEELGPGARIWIYQAERPLDAPEVGVVDRHLRPFLEDWKAHGRSLKCSYTILRGQFVVIAVDENDQKATGCSIDSSIGLLERLQMALGVSLLDRSKVPFAIDGRVRLVDFRRIRDLVGDGIIQDDTETFNNAVTLKAQLESDWITPASRSWVRRYLT